MSTTTLAVFVGIVLNLIPADASTFTMQMKGGDKGVTIQFTKQADGGWKGIHQGEREASLRVFYLAGTKVACKVGDKEETEDLAKVIGVDEKTQWKDLKKVNLRSIPVDIEHEASGLNFISKELTIQVRWKTNE
jgi:hypothetical protein